MYALCNLAGKAIKIFCPAAEFSDNTAKIPK